MRERVLQAVLVVVGLYYCVWGYLLFDNLFAAKPLTEHSDVMPMFLSLNAALGPCLLLAVRRPDKNLLMIFCGAFSSLLHASTMTVQSIQYEMHGMHRHDSPQDIVINGAMGLLLLAVLALYPRKKPDMSGQRA